MTAARELAIFKWALGLVVGGLVVEMVCLWDMTPGTFVIFASLGVPLVLLGILLFVVGLWRLPPTKGDDAP